MQVEEGYLVGRTKVRGSRMSSGVATLEFAKRWVQNRVKNVPIAKPLPQTAYRMHADGWYIPIDVALAR